MAQASLSARRDLPSDKVRGFIERAAMRFGGLDGREAARLSGRVVQPLVALTPLGMADDAVQQSRENAAALGRGERVPALGGAGTALAALGAVPGGRGAKAALGEAVGGAKGIIAYHGSPHKFDRFDMSKIGTGEGAQAYGHGLYFAEREATAKSYRDSLGGAQLMVDGKPVPGGRVGVDPLAKNFRAQAALHIKDSGGDIERAIADVERSRLARKDGGYGYWDNEADAVLREIEALRGARVRSKPGGHLYQVRIDADPADFLDWDADMEGQSAAAASQFLDKRLRRYLGQSYDRQAMNYEFSQAGELLAETDGVNLSGPRMAREARRAGLPGIKYRDAGSRASFSDSRNYVVFDDKLVTILKRYGWVPGTAVPAGIMAQASQDYERQEGRAVPTRDQPTITFKPQGPSA